MTTVGLNRLSPVSGIPRQVLSVTVAQPDRTYAEILGWICTQLFPTATVRVFERGEEVAAALRNEPSDLVLLGLSFADLDGVELILQINQERLARDVIVVTDTRSRLLMATLRSVGVAGILDTSTESLDNVRQAIRTVCEGRAYVSPSFRPYLPDRRSEAREDLNLTATECRVLHIIGMGQSNRQAAVVLGLSEATVQTHRRNIMRKLNVSTSARLVWEAMRLGLVHVASWKPDAAGGLPHSLTTTAVAN